MCYFLTSKTAGEWTVANLKSLNVSNCSLVDPNKYTTKVLELTKLKCLTSLNVSGTNFNRKSLELVVEDLKQLEYIDISCTKVSDITSLKKLQNQLKGLFLYGINFSPSPDILSETVEILSNMQELRQLDISDAKSVNHPFDILNSNQGRIPVIPFLTSAMQKLPYLTSLDLSGNFGVELECRIPTRD